MARCSIATKGTLLYTSATAAFRSTGKSAMIAAGKMALRGLSQSVAKEYGKQGIHAVHLRMDCTFESARNQSVFTSVGMGETYGKMAGGRKLAERLPGMLDAGAPDPSTDRAASFASVAGHYVYWGTKDAGPEKA